MSMTEDPHTWSGAVVRNTEGAVLGRVDGVYFHASTGRATWAEVTDGVGTAMVPLDHAVLDGDGLRLPYRVEQLVTAPRHDLGGYLEPQAEQALYRHYGLPTTDPGTADPGTVEPDPAGPDVADLATTTPNPALSHSDGSTDVVRSEEQLRVGVQRRIYGRARLVTYLVTENQTFTVPVTRQEVRLEPVPLSGTDPESDGPVGELVEDVYEVVLHRQEVSFTKTVVPSERVRLVRRIVSGQQPITTALRQEQIDLDRTDVDTVARTPARGIAQVRRSSAPSES